MSFRMKDKCVSWFKNIDRKKPFTTQFDLYYLCLMLGFAAGRRSEVRNSDGNQPPEFIKNFTDDYKPSKSLIIGLLLISRMKAYGLDLEDKNDIQDVIVQYISSESSTGLSEEGIKELNKFASGGFDFLAEQLDSKPHHPDEFLRTYVNILQSAIDNNSWWKSYNAECFM